MHLSIADFAAAGAATFVAGGVNALAGGGTLVSFPTLLAIGVPSLSANVTNTVALCPGYFGGTWAQRADLVTQRQRLRALAVAAGLGGLTGSALLEVTSEATFRAVVPYLLVLACVLLAGQDRVRGWVRSRADVGVTVGPTPDGRPSVALLVTAYAGAIYGGFFGAGLGIFMLAFLGLFIDETMVRINALKQAMSVLINTVAAVFFAISGHVAWELVPVMSVASLAGGTIGGRMSRVVNPTWLRRAVVVFGLGVAVDLWVRG